MNKKMKSVYLTGVMLLLLFLTGCGSTINLNKYVTYDFSGYDSLGKVDVDLDYQKLEEDYGDKIKYKGGEDTIYGLDIAFGNSPLVSMFTYGIDADIDKTDHLSNGDVVRIKWECQDAQIKEYFGTKLKYSDMEIKVSGLEEVGKFSPFDHVDIEISGADGYGNAQIGNDGSESAMKDISLSADKTELLKNGDVVTVKVELLTSEEEFVEAYGKVPSEFEKQYTVDGLTPVEEFDPFDGFEILFSGVDGEGTAHLGKSMANGLTYNISPNEHLKVGQSVTVSVDLSNMAEYAAKNGKVPNPTGKSFKVEKLDTYTITEEDVDDQFFSRLKEAAYTAVKDETGKQCRINHNLANLVKKTSGFWELDGYMTGDYTLKKVYIGNNAADAPGNRIYAVFEAPYEMFVKSNLWNGDHVGDTIGEGTVYILVRFDDTLMKTEDVAPGTIYGTDGSVDFKELEAQVYTHRAEYDFMEFDVSQSDADTSGDSEEDSSEDEASAEYLKAYTDYMKKKYGNSGEKVECALVYIDDDDIPEAVIGEYDGDDLMNAELLTYNGGEVGELIVASILDGSASFIPQKNLIHYWGGDGEEYTDTVYSIKDGSLFLEQGIGNKMDDSGKIEYFEFDNPNWWNNYDSISQKEYEKKEADTEKMFKGAEDLEKISYYASFDEAFRNL